MTNEKNSPDAKKSVDNEEMKDKKENFFDKKPKAVKSKLSEDITEKVLKHPTYKELEEKLTLSEQKTHDYWEKLTRLTAELENVNRRADKKISDAHRFGNEKLLTSLFDVIDSLEHALNAAKENKNKDENKAMIEGLELTMKQFISVLAKFDVQQIDPMDSLFNPEEHEAMSIQENTGKKPNTVIMVFQKGYKLHDRVIRPARVIVAK